MHYETYHTIDDSGARACTPEGWKIGEHDILINALAEAAKHTGGYVRRTRDGAVLCPPGRGPWIGPDGEEVN